MKLISLLLCTALLAAAGASQAADRAQTPARGRGLVAPPAPPAPPEPPAPGMAPEAPMPPEPPMLSMLAPPPPPPPLPAIPDAAHKACAGKAVGAALTYHPRRGISMRGTCQKDEQGMYFDLEEYRIAN